MGLNRNIHLIKTRIKIIKDDIKKYHFKKLFSMIKMWSKGFSYDKYYLYNIKENNLKDYLSDYCRAKTVYINFPYNHILNNKIIFEKVFNQYLRVAKNYAYIEKGNIHALKEEYSFNNIEDVYNLLIKEGALVVKPVSGGGGKGVSILKYVENNLYFDKNKIDKNVLIKYLHTLDDYVITEFIKQGSFPAQFTKESTNTIRIIMMRNPKTNEPFIAGCAHRFGSSKSSGKDNFSLGGFSVGIDIKTGILSSAVTNPQKGKLLWFDKHPETNKQIKGVKIPNWDKIKTELISVMEKIPYIKYIGWDIILTDDGIIAIEGNDHPETRSVQAHVPLLIDENVKAFYKYHNIIKK